MSVRLSVGDVVLVKPIKDRTCIGLIKYVGPIIDHDILVEYVGIELLESIPNGHNGTIGNFQYFTTSKGHGFHTKITNVIKKLSIRELFNQMKQLRTSSHKKTRRILKLESVLNNYKNNMYPTPTPKIDTSLPSMSPRSHSPNSNCSCQSRLSHAYSMAASLTAYSYNTSNKNPNLPNIVKKLPFESNSSNSVSTSVQSIKNHKTHRRKSSSVYSTESVSSNDSDSYSNYSEINETRKQKHKPKHKTKKAAKLSRSKSYSHQSNENPMPAPTKKQIIRRRSRTTEHHKAETLYQLQPYNNNVRYSVNNIEKQIHAPVAIPPRQPMMLISQSAPSSPYMTSINTNQLPSKHQMYHSVHNSNSYHLEQPNPMMLNTVSLPQSNTQVVEDNELTYNMYNHTPSSSGNMLMVNNAYSPYVHHYNDQSGSYVSHVSNGSRMSNVSLGRNSNVSLSPYRAQLVAYNEYYRRNSRNSVNSVIMNQSPTPTPTQIIPNQKMYCIQKNGHEIVYQHK